MSYQTVKLTDVPQMKDTMALWFHEKWNIPLSAYLESMDQCLAGQLPVPEWYAVLDGDRIIGGLGVIENDFHDRIDLSPNVCALYVEPDYRGQGLAGRLLDLACCDMLAHGIDTLYLVTDHASFYERYGWEYLCPIRCYGETQDSRMYVKAVK